MNEKERIKQFIRENFVLGLDGEELGDTDSFLEKGIIDSTGVLEVVGFLEETYGFKVEDEEVLPDNFDSVNNLVAYIARKQGAAVSQAVL